MGPAGIASRLGKAKKALGFFPTKLNRARPQPYDPTTGRWLSYADNELTKAIPRSPVGRFAGFIGYGYGDAKGAGPVPDPVGPLETTAYWIGYIGGTLFGP